MEPSEADGWIDVASAADVPDAKAVRVTAQGIDVFLYRTDDQIFALANRCTHQGGPLHRGVVKASGPNPTVTCPIHGSIFRLTDGRVMRGPALVPQPRYKARVNGERVEVRPA